MARAGLSFRAKLFLLCLALSVVPAVCIALLAMRHLERSVDLRSNKGISRTLDASRAISDSLVAWDAARLEADPALTVKMADFEMGLGFFRRLQVLAPVEKRALAIEMGLVVALLIGASLVLAARAGRRLLHPIGLLMKGTERVRAGDLGHRIPLSGSDEISRLIVSWNEMTESLRSSLERIRRIERTAAWGEAARRVAHEIKNPLTPIELSLHRVRTRLPEMPDTIRGTIEESTRAMLEEVEKLRRLAEEFSAFSRLPAPRPAPCDLAALVREVAALHGRDGIEFEVSTPPALPILLVDAFLLRIAIGNLVKNACEAIGERGRVTLAVSFDGRAAAIDVADDGPGIAPNDRDRVFDPYFTTKERGTGIGLALVERIAVDLGGTVSLVDSPAPGARFRVEIPMTLAEEHAHE
ncbi:MAG: sensor histidine kinase [bacterium]